MTRSSDWEKVIERRTANLGYISKLGAFRDPTEAEKARALMIETKSWQESIGKKTFKVSGEYEKPLIHLKWNKEHLKGHLEAKKRAITAYVETPMDVEFKRPMKWYQRIAEDPSLFEEILVGVLPWALILGLVFMILKLKEIK